MRTGPGFYSRLVAVLKVLLPLVALGLLSALFLIQTDDTSDSAIVFSRGDVDETGDGLRIRNPTFTGMTDSDDRFSFSAALVIPDAAPPTRASIETLTGTMTFRDSPDVDVAADSGEIDIAARRISLSGNVRIETSDGYRTLADHVVIDMAAGSVEGGDQVETTGPLGRIDSGTLRIEPAAAGDARRFSFGNGVRLVYDPPPAED